MAIKNKDDRNIAVMTSHITKNRQLFSDVIQQDSHVFSDILSLDAPSNESKTQIRKNRMRKLREQLEAAPANNIYTGTDRNIEFQYAMHYSTQKNKSTKGIYLDEGTQTYLGHKHMHKLQHKVIDPLLKKLVYGCWWKTPLIIGPPAIVNA